MEQEQGTQREEGRRKIEAKREKEERGGAGVQSQCYNHMIEGWLYMKRKRGRQCGRCINAYSIHLFSSKISHFSVVWANQIGCIRWKPMGDSGVDQSCGCGLDKSTHHPDTVHLS